MKIHTLLASSLAIFTLNASGALVSNWAENTSAGGITAQGAGFVTIGDNTSASANNSQLLGSFADLTLVNVGDSISLSATIELKGAASISDQLRVGLFDAPNFQGYRMANNLMSSGSSNVHSGTGATLFATGPGPALGTGIYTTSLVLTLEAGGVRVVTSLTDGVTEYSGFNYLDAISSQGLNYNGAGFLAGGTFNADQFLITNADVTYTAAVPEPSSVALLGLGGLAFILRRRK